MGAGGGGGGTSQAMGTQLAMCHLHIFSLGSSKIKVSYEAFPNIVTTKNDHPIYVKHALGRIFLFFTLFED